MKNGNVLLKKKKKKKKKIKYNDIIYFFYKKNFFIKKKNKIYKNKNIKINIKYEDKDIIIINKKPGLIVHPGCGNYKNTLVNWLKYYNYKNNNNLNYNEYKYGLLHRLDKDTSGLLIIAKNIKSYNNIKNQFINRTIKKKYLAIVNGIPKKNNYIIKNYIGRNLKNRLKMQIFNNKKYGKLSITKLKIIKKFNNFSIIKCYLITGRTHQIRVHLQYIGNPVLNDLVYKNNNNIKNNIIINNYLNKIKRQALHSYYIKFKHPKNNKYIKFISNLPKDMNKILNLIKKNNL
ncbi:MAG: RluA family pseudouridine synthase [Candidatus Shikimatogenerans bostrichidophilus]|nr:MAG: RluA family pseudouridine synthase [Candidatus Shikimatogenerans bostrichidophilus]